MYTNYIHCKGCVFCCLRQLIALNLIRNCVNNFSVLFQPSVLSREFRFLKLCVLLFIGFDSIPCFSLFCVPTNISFRFVSFFKPFIRKAEHSRIYWNWFVPNYSAHFKVFAKWLLGIFFFVCSFYHKLCRENEIVRWLGNGIGNKFEYK